MPSFLTSLQKCTTPFKQVTSSPSFVKTSAMTVYFPCGTCLGILTCRVSSILPFFNGHFRSTLATWSHRSAVWWMRVIRPYFTVRATVAPGSISRWKRPEPVMLRVVPLDEESNYCGRETEVGKLDHRLKGRMKGQRGRGWMKKEQQAHVCGGFGSRSA